MFLQNVQQRQCQETSNSLSLISSRPSGLPSRKQNSSLTNGFTLSLFSTILLLSAQIAVSPPSSPSANYLVSFFMEETEEI